MIAKRYQELEAWQVANELKLEVYAITATGPVTRDFKFCSQLRESAASAPRNISEGFGRYRPKPFAVFMEIAIATTMETQNNLQDGIDRGHFHNRYDQPGELFGRTIAAGFHKAPPLPEKLSRPLNESVAPR